MQPSTLLCGKRPSGKLQNGERAASLRRTTWRSSHKSTLILQFALTVFVCITVLIPPTRSNAQQIAGSLSGKVTDAVGASVASAKLTATNTQTGVAATTTSDSDGAYTFPSLARACTSYPLNKPAFPSQ
jgi:Carboxypeptidase regulatory-like domain